MNSIEILQLITELFLYYLDELESLPRNDFIHGEMTAYVECLELIRNWNNSDERLKQNIADKYKI